MTAKIVYIDDEPMLCRAFRAVLGSVDIPVETFTDVDAALAYIDSHDVAVVFCDYRMPQLSGLDVRARIHRDVDFYLVSGDPELVASLAGDARISGVLPKPYRPDTVLALARNYVDKPSE